MEAVDRRGNGRRPPCGSGGRRRRPVGRERQLRRGAAAGAIVVRRLAAVGGVIAVMAARRAMDDRRAIAQKGRQRRRGVRVASGGANAQRREKDRDPGGERQREGCDALASGRAMRASSCGHVRFPESEDRFSASLRSATPPVQSAAPDSLARRPFRHSARRSPDPDGSLHRAFPRLFVALRRNSGSLDQIDRLTAQGVLFRSRRRRL